MIFSLLILGAIVLGVGVTLLVLTVLLMASTLLRPPRMTDGKATYLLERISPGDLGLRFEELKFQVRDEKTGEKLPIAAWWIPHPAAEGRCVVLIHGYADGKVGAIAWAQLWHELGYNIVALDLRAHGYSGGNHTTAGYFERHDVDQVLNELLRERGGQMRQIVLFGVSLGAAVALAVAEMRDDVAALVLECPYADYRHAVAAHAQLMQMPLPGFVELAVRAAEWISGADFRAASPRWLLPLVKAPVMVIHGEEDPFVPDEDAKAIEAIMRQRGGQGLIGEYWRVSGAGHVHGIAADPDEYQRRIRQFLAACSAEVASTTT